MIVLVAVFNFSWTACAPEGDNVFSSRYLKQKNVIFQKQKYQLQQQPMEPCLEQEPDHLSFALADSLYINYASLA